MLSYVYITLVMYIFYCRCRLCRMTFKLRSLVSARLPIWLCTVFLIAVFRFWGDFGGGGLSYITPFVYISVIFPCLKIRLYHYFIYSGSIAAYYFSVHIDSLIYSGSIAVYYYILYSLFIPARPPYI